MQICETDITGWIAERDKKLAGRNIKIKITIISGIENNRLRVPN